jgi:hypothetical protein
MRREEIDVHHRAVGQVRNAVESRYRRNRRSRAYIDENLIGRELGTVHCHFLFRDKAATALVNLASLLGLQRSLDAIVEHGHNGILPRLDCLHVDLGRALDPDAVIAGAACDMRNTAARGQRLGRSTAGVHACAAEQLAFDDRDLPACSHQSPAPRPARTAQCR